jgi:nucleotide-binding universal stress UspA family protein
MDRSTEIDMTVQTDIPAAGGIGDIVVGMDDSPSSRAALDWAAKAARSSGDRLRAVHVLDAATTSPRVWTNGFPATAYVAETAEPGIAKDTMVAMFGAVAPEPSWTLEFRNGSAGQQLVQASTGARMLVVGTREHVGLQRLIKGSVSHYCLTHSTCPVAAVPPAPGLRERAPVEAGHDLAEALANGGVL